MAKRLHKSWGNQWVIGHNAFGIESGTPTPLGQTFAAVAGFTNEAVLAVGNYNLSSSNINTNGITNTAAQTITIPLTVAYYITSVTTGSFQIVVDTNGANTNVTPSFYFLIVN